MYGLCFSIMLSCQLPAQTQDQKPLQAQRYFNQPESSTWPSDPIDRDGSIGIGTTASANWKLIATTSANNVNMGGIKGEAYAGIGISGTSYSGVGVSGVSSSVFAAGVVGANSLGSGVYGSTVDGTGIVAVATGSGDGMKGFSLGTGTAGLFESTNGIGLYGKSNSPFHPGVLGENTNGWAVEGTTQDGTGVMAIASGAGNAFNAIASGTGRAGLFSGSVKITMPTDDEHFLIGERWNFYNDDNLRRFRMGYNVQKGGVGVSEPIDPSIGTAALVFNENGNIDIQTGVPNNPVEPPITFSIQGDGKVLIGDVATMYQHKQTNCLLYVQQGILTEKVKMSLSSTWPDYVFAPNYQLPELSQLKNYLAKEKHLPNLPSAAEIEKEGSIELGEMCRLQQEKIEELYLYLIQMQETLAQQQEEITKLKHKK